ncbi:MAG: hypothetical protein KC457_35855, partial [Myxococcales bacterium]|nr:hypothetical protein [Myxococcales bacterium]
VIKHQYGKLPWPDPVPEWSTGALDDLDDALARAKTDIEEFWCGDFEFKREGCASADPSCCRHTFRSEIAFVEVPVKKRGIILAENDTRANASAWPLDIDAKTAAHEFGHHLGNPDEYAGAQSVDPSVNGDGAKAGIDEESIMGAGWIMRRRHLDSVAEVLAMAVASQTGKPFTFRVVRS